MKKSTRFYIPVFIISTLFITAFSGAYYFQINKSFDIFGDVFRNIAIDYVEDIDPEVLMKWSIEGMLSHLDPYTEFYEAVDNDDIEIITSGSYVGLGFSVAIKDSMLTITDLRKGYSAKNNGLKIGDKIYKINDDIVLNNSTHELRKYTDGLPGTTIDMWVFREGINDTLKFKLIREKIVLNNISYASYISDNIGYIKLDRFSIKTAGEFRDALFKLKQQDSLKGLIIDLRDNPGGLLEAAVSVCEMFLPKESIIVSTKGRNGSNEYTYKSYHDPIEPNLPLAILINENSASASEIVAGAIQDNDRGVIIGRSSYGKGLVQSVVELPYRSILKLTTARYYTPSGRCIQRSDVLNEGSKVAEVNDKQKHKLFYTNNGREVLEFIGIIPDTLVDKESQPEILSDLQRRDLLFNYANKYCSKLDSLNKGFHLSDKEYKSFLTYLDESDYLPEGKISRLLNDLEYINNSNDFNKNIKKNIKELSSELKRYNNSEVSLYKNEILKSLENEIKRRYVDEESIFSEFLKEDTNIKTAYGLFVSKNYKKIIAGNASIENGN